MSERFCNFYDSWKIRAMSIKNFRIYLLFESIKNSTNLLLRPRNALSGFCQAFTCHRGLWLAGSIQGPSVHENQRSRLCVKYELVPEDCRWRTINQLSYLTGITYGVCQEILICELSSTTSLKENVFLLEKSFFSINANKDKVKFTLLVSILLQYKMDIHEDVTKN